MQDNMEKNALTEEQKIIYEDIVKCLSNYAGVDFVQYKESTIFRRIKRRMGLVHVETMEEYLDILLASKEEKQDLYQDILIGVTDFFRDRECFESLYKYAVKKMLEAHPQEIRIWSVACSSGEEAYSLGILFSEANEIEGTNIPVKIFATDLDKRNIDMAQQGIYREENLKNIEPDIVQKYFEQQGEFFRIKECIRKMIVFAQHDVLKDAPFSRLDLVVCRNMFIYIKPEAQRNALITFYKALRGDGYLFLGNSETLGKIPTIFKTLDKKNKIYQRDSEKEDSANREYVAQLGAKDFTWQKAPYALQDKALESKIVERILHFLTESALVVGENGETLRLIRGEDEHSEEELSELRTEISLEERIRQLEQELQQTSEEMIISNEELQSANEEFQSVNEELSAVNSELQDKIDALIKANVDLDNLLRNAEIGALYIDRSLKIRKITPIMEKNTRLFLADIGRPITHVQFMEGYNTLEEDVKRCLKEGQTIEREVDRNGIIWMLRLRPYYAESGVVEGVTIILFDVTKRLEAAKYELNLLMNSIPGGVAKMRYDNGLIIEYGNEAMYKMLGISREEMIERYCNHYERLIFPGDWSVMQKKIAECIETGKMLQMEYPVHSFTTEKEVWRMMQAVVLENGNKPVLECVITDITATKQAFLDLELERKKLNIIARMSGNVLFEYDISTDVMIYTSNQEGEQMTQVSCEDYLEAISVPGFVHKDDVQVLKEYVDAIRGGKCHISMEIRTLEEDGEYHWLRLEGASIYNAKGQAEKVIGKIENIDEQKNRELEFKERSEKDSLTGLFNHGTIKMLIQQNISNASMEEEAFLLVADVDNFKKVNDVNGHLFGDAVLCSISDKLQNTFPDSLIGRIGGDEFIVFVEGMKREELEQRLIKLRQSILSVYQEDGSGVTSSCSFGVVLCDGSIRDLNILFRWADYALYQVKRGEKGDYSIVVPNQNKEFPEGGYLSEFSIDQEYTREDFLIRSEEDLILFCLELMDNVADIRNGLKMMSDRICRFFHCDDIMFVRNFNGSYEKEYHWSAAEKKQHERDTLPGSKEEWDYMDTCYDEQGVFILRKKEIPFIKDIVSLGSVMFVKSKDQGAYKGHIIYVDRENDRDWVAERDVLCRLGTIIFNRLQQQHEVVRERQEMEWQLNYDTMTKFPWYFKFLEFAGQYRKEHPEKPCFFVYSDFSNFQYLNEVHGYMAGDLVLKEFARELRDNCKGGLYFTRVTSDHFISMLTGDSIEKLAEDFLDLSRNFCQRINARYSPSNLMLISGICKAEPEHDSVSATLDYANIARKYGKENMETAVILYSEEIKVKNEAEKTIVTNMITALEQKEYVVYLQPKICLATERIVGAEALVRWQRKDGTLVYPDAFIPIFEKNGFITKVDFSVLEQVLEYIREALETGEKIVPISVNFSRRHTESMTFADDVEEKLKKYGTPRGLLELEVTESIFMTDLSVLKDSFERIHDMGVSISIDDFGSGYSSLTVLTTMPADVIKLDRKFLAGMGEDLIKSGVIRYLIKMMKLMGLNIVAEGVETKAQIEFLKETECDMVQGYYYARPMPLSQFRGFLEEYNNKK